MGKIATKSDWVQRGLREPPWLHEAMDAFCKAGPTRSTEEEYCAAVNLYRLLPPALQDLSRLAVFGDADAQAELEAKMAVFRDGWPQWTASGAA